MSFSQVFEKSLQNPSERIRKFTNLLNPVSDTELASMAAESAAVTRRFFGKTMRLFAPLYLSNECINSCTYCGFSRENAIARVTLEIAGVKAEAEFLARQGFRNLLLVAGEHPKFVSNGYLAACISTLAPVVPSLAIEVAPMETPEYREMTRAGAEGLVVYQETYHRDTYRELHLSGPKKDFDWRLDCPERGHAAGFRRIGIGALFGLYDWRFEAVALANHLEYLQKVCWRAFFTVSMPRIRPAAGGFVPSHPLPDREFLQLICAFRICFPHVGIVLSTREPAELRDLFVPYGITMMSAGSHTEPGGYTGQGTEELHLTVRGRIAQLDVPADSATGQFEISDDRSPAEIARVLSEKGMDPVWKDWDAGILGAQHAA
jgi:2-iminoacetate synthase